MNFKLWILICCIIKTCLSCSNESSCTKIQLSSQPEDMFLRAIRCHDWCLKQYEVEISSISVYSEWPSLNISELTSDCYKYQKVEQCQVGCLTAFHKPTLTPNRCRDSCHLKCTKSCGGKKQCQLSNRQCFRKCRKPSCKRGCQYSLELQTPDFIPSQPVSSPILTSSDEGEHFYHISFLSVTSSLVYNTSDWVNFLFKVQDKADNITRYYWQTDLVQPLKLTAFACRQVQVSMSVVTTNYKTNYSPVTTICLHKKDIKSYPSQVRSDLIEVNYTEDPHHTGLATITVSWALPQNYQAVSSYSVYFLSRKAECGGLNRLFSFEGLKENSTVVSANVDAHFPRFGCTYKMLIKVHPSIDKEDGTQLDVTPKLPELAERIKLNCSAIHISNNPLLLAVNWTLPNNSMAIETIDHFSLTIDNFERDTIKANTSQRSYLLNTVISNVTAVDSITVTLIPVKNSQYYWRPLLKAESCQVSVPPNIPLSVFVAMEHINCTTVHLNISWSVSSGSSTQIQLAIGNILAYPVYKSTVNTQNNSTFLTIKLSGSNNYYLWARSLQNGNVSSWTSPIQILKASKNCHRDSTKERLKNLEKKMEKLSQSYKSIEQLSKQLQRFEQKLNNITNDLFTM